MNRALTEWRELGVAVVVGVISCTHRPPRNPTAAPPLVSLPLDELGAMRVVHVEIEGKGTLNLTVDTGASITIVDAAAVDRLHLSVSEPTRAFSLHGIGGMRPAKWVEIPSASLGGVAMPAPGRWATLPLDEMEATFSSSSTASRESTCLPPSCVAASAGTTA